MTFEVWIISAPALSVYIPNAHTSTHTLTHKHIHTYIHINAHGRCIPLHTNAHTARFLVLAPRTENVCVCVCMCVCMCVCVCADLHTC